MGLYIGIKKYSQTLNQVIYHIKTQDLGGANFFAIIDTKHNILIIYKSNDFTEKPLATFDLTHMQELEIPTIDKYVSFIVLPKLLKAAHNEIFPDNLSHFA